MQRALMKEFGLTDSGYIRLVRAIDKRHPWRTQIPWLLAVLCWAVISACLYFPLTVLEGTKWDLRDLLGLNRSLNAGIYFAMFWFAGPALGINVSLIVRRRMLRTDFARYLGTPFCIGCGYDLRTLECRNETVRCPECGQQSPVRSSTLTPAPASGVLPAGPEVP